MDLSLQPISYLNYYDFSSGSVTTIANTTTFVKLNTSTVLGFSNNGLTHSNNRITNTSGGRKILKIDGITSVSSGNNNVIMMAFFKNGTIIPSTEQDVPTSGSGRAHSIPIQAVIELNINEYVEVWIKNSTAVQNITLNHINVISIKLN